MVLYTIIEMYVVEENTNNHGFRRFVPEPKMEEKVRIYTYIETITLLNHYLNFRRKKKDSLENGDFQIGSVLKKQPKK